MNGDIPAVSESDREFLEKLHALSDTARKVINEIMDIFLRIAAAKRPELPPMARLDR